MVIEMANKVDETISSARRMSEKVGDSIHEQIDESRARSREQRKLVDDFVNENPYMAMGIGLLAGLGLGLVLSGLTRRHRD